MTFQVQTQRSGDVAVLQCAGRIVRGEALRTLRDVVTGLQDTRVVVLDVTEVDTVDGGGLGMLVFLHRWARDNGIQVKLVNPSALVRETLERTRLDGLFDISSLHDIFVVLGGNCCDSEHAQLPHRSIACCMASD